MDTLGERLLVVMQELGIDAPKDLAKFCNVTEGLVSQWFSGKTKLGPKPLKAFAKTHFNVEWIASGNLPKYRDGQSNVVALNAYHVRQDRTREVPVIGKGMGGIPDDRTWTDSDFPAGTSNEYAELATSDKNAFLAEIVEGSMSPRYNPGEYALIEPNTQAEIEDDVLVRFRNDGTALKRLLSRRDGYVRLGSYNSIEVITCKEEDIAWIYYSAHPVPRKKIKNRM